MLDDRFGRQSGRAVGIVYRHMPAVVATLALWACVGVLLYISVGQNQGHVVYVLDDSYIHMAVARNLAQHGVWGISQYGFSSVTSSIAWPLLLAGVYLVFGPNEIAPLLLNLVFATALVWLAYVMLRSHK